MTPAPMTTPFEAPAGGERRLHPLSWLFVLLSSLREFAVPLLAVLFFGRRGNDTWEFLGALGGGALALHALAQYFTYRFRIERDELLIRSGLLQRNLRHIPFRRIHNVTLHQGPLHRLLGVAEVRLESAGGAAPEARMRVLRLADAQALEALLRQHGPGAAASSPSPTGAAPLLELSTGELIRLGLISNRGMVVVAAALGVLAQGDPSRMANLVRWAGGPLERLSAELAPLGPLVWLLDALLLFVLLVALLRGLSVALAIVQFHGFRLRRDGDRLQLECGLFSRVRGNAPVRRIQAWHLRESLLHRWFGRRSLRVDTVVPETPHAPRALRELAPIARPQRIDALIGQLLPGCGWPDLPWQPLHPRAWRRLLLPPALLTVLAGALLAGRYGATALWLWLLLPWWWLRARKLAARMRYALGDRLLAVRGGWIDRRWCLVEIGKLQALQLRQSPFDRRHGMASLRLDTAGANPGRSPLRIRYLPEAQARALLEELERRIAATRLRW